MQETVTIEIAKEAHHFSAAHFTVFSATERENLHGHNFQVEATFDGTVGEGGLCFDYNVPKTKLAALCEGLDEVLLIPALSPHLSVSEEGETTRVDFAGERLSLPRRDVKTLPLRNITVEELARWFLEELRSDARIAALPVSSITLRVSSGPGQWARATWSAGAS